MHLMMLFIWLHDPPSWRGDVIEWRYLENSLTFCITHQISGGPTQATETIFWYVEDRDINGLASNSR